MKVRRLAVPLLCMLTAAVSAQSPEKAVREAAAPALVPVQVRTSVTRTAVWVGDPVTYTIELTCAPKVDILTDDLAAERLPLSGLELLGVEVERDATIPDRITHRMRYQLVAYEPDAPTLSVGAVPVRYFFQQAGKKAEDVVPAGEVKVPPLALSLRSTIPEGMTAEVRDDRAVRPLPRWVYWARPAGITLVALAVLPVALWAADLAQRARRRARSTGPRRQSRRQRLAALREIKALDVSSPDALRRAYAQLDVWVRTNLQQATGVAALAMTPAEIGASAIRGRRAVQMEQVQHVLLECERAKYAPDNPSPDGWQTVLLEAENSLGADAR
jgi:hypothetical protein